MSNDQKLQYKIVGPATWELIRAAYLAGESAPTLAERYNVGIYAIRRRATKEKWTKRGYATALEARGMAAPQKPPPPNYIEEAVLREQQRLAGDSARDAEIHTWIEKIAAEEEAFDMAGAMERRALAQASAALVQGRSKDAQALAGLAEQMRKHKLTREMTPPPASVRVASFAPASEADMEAQVQAQLREAIAEGRAGDAKTLAALAEQMRKRAGEDRVAARVEEDAAALEEEDRASLAMEMFGRIAYIAGAIVHHPTSAPAAFLRMVKRWREINLGEGEADAEAAATRVAAANASYLDGSWLETTPEDVRAYLGERWEEVRKEFERSPG